MVRHNDLNGWQRLWILASIMYLVFIVFISVIDFPTPWKTIIAEEKITKSLSAKTRRIIDLQQTPVDKGGIFDKVAVDQSKLITIEFPNGNLLFVPAGTKQAELDYVNKDYCDTVN